MRMQQPAIALNWRLAALIASACAAFHPGSAPALDEATSALPRAQPPATLKKARPAIARNARVISGVDEKSPSGTSAVRVADLRASSPVVSVTGTGPGQAGYVHFFIVRESGGEWETQVGIEMPDQRIAWSFFELGVAVSPFIETGYVPANRQLIEVQYLYGVRPFPDEEAMRTLRAEIEARVLPWAEAETPYCIVRGPSDPQCVSCLGFVLRILFPGPTPAYAALPRDFAHTEPKSIYDTDDFLLYLTGLHGLGGKDARLKRVDELALPENLREDVVRLVNKTAGNSTAGAPVEPPNAPAEKGQMPAPRVAKPAQPRASQPGKS